MAENTREYYGRLATLRPLPHPIPYTVLRSIPEPAPIATPPPRCDRPFRVYPQRGAVFTIGYVATLLGENENWLHDLSIDMFPEDGCLWVYGIGEDRVPAFSRDGIENLRQIIADA